VLGAIVLAIVIVIAIPVGVLMTGAVVAGVLGWRLKADADERAAGSELLELS
jgi:hypothetical protein